MKDEDEDPFGLLHWPEEFTFSINTDEDENQFWSEIAVDVGLKGGDLRPLANHLRRGFPLTIKMSEMIADAIDGKPTAICTIKAKRKRGRKSDAFGSLKFEQLRIGKIVHEFVRSAGPGEYEAAIEDAVNSITPKIGRTKAIKAHGVFSEYLKGWIATTSA